MSKGPFCHGASAEALLNSFATGAEGGASGLPCQAITTGSATMSLATQFEKSALSLGKRRGHSLQGSDYGMSKIIAQTSVTLFSNRVSLLIGAIATILVGSVRPGPSNSSMSFSKRGSPPSGSQNGISFSWP